MKFCIIISDPTAYAPERLAEEIKKSGHELAVVHWSDITLNTESRQIYFGLSKGGSLNDFDFIIPRSGRYTKDLGEKKILKDYTFLLKLIAQYEPFAKYSLLNAEYYRNLSGTDKLTQQFIFALRNLPGIETSFNGEFSQFLTDEYPFVAKTIQGSKGEGVERIENKEQRDIFIGQNRNNLNFFIKQKYYQIDSDYRILVLGDKVLGGIRRFSEKNQWKTNFSAGGSVEKYEIGNDLKEIALKTAKLMNLDYVGIDFLKDGNNFKIIETNALAQFKGFESVNKEVNVAKEIIDFIMFKK